MNQAYKPFQKKADHLFHKTEGMIDDRHAAEQIAKISMDIREMIENDRTPRAVEDRIRQLEHLLEPLAAHPGNALTPREAGTLLDEYESLRGELRRLPNY
jgi:plasmid stabilization system protein ParE